MAEPVIVPVRLEVTDIDMSGANFVDAEKQISKSLSGIKQSIQDAFKGVDASAINKPIKQSMAAVEKSVQAAEDAYIRYKESIIRAGKSTEEYKTKVSEANAAIRGQETLINELSQLGPAALPHLEEARKKLETLIDTRNKINPVDFVDNASPIQLEKIASAYRKVLSAQEAVNKRSEDFNQTAKDNRVTDEYNDMLKQAEAYKKKLDELNEKSKRMEALGATDKQWEALRYDTEQVSSKMDELVKKMRDAVKTGKALRFGDGPKADLSRQINSFAMAGGNRAGAITARAKSNESPFTKEYQDALNELDKLEKKIESVRAKSEKMLAMGASKNQFKNMVYDAEQLDIKVDEVKNHLMNMATEGKAFKFGTGDADGEITKIRDKTASMQSTLSGVSMSAQKAQGGLTALAATNPKLAAILGTAGKIASALGTVLKVAGKAGVAIVRGFVGAAKVLGKVASAVGKVASGFINLGKRIIGSIRNLNIFGKSGQKTSKDLNSRFKKLGKNILMFGLGFRTAYYAIKRLRNIFIEGFKQMGSQFDKVGQPMMRLMEAFNRLKGSLATAFQPLVSVVMPILTTFMNYLSSALEAVGTFMAALTGQGHIYKAVAKNIDSVSDSAKEANKQLGSYDKLEVIQKNDQDENKTGYTYEQQEIDANNVASKFAQMVKDAWAKADFTDVGQFITEQLLKVLDNVEQNVLPGVLNFVNRLLQSVNTFLTGFDTTAIGEKFGSIINTIVEGLDWEQLGALFANLNNTVWGFFDGLVSSINWTTLGESLAIGIGSMFNSLNLESWSGMISGLVNGIVTTIKTTLEGVDWTEVGTTLGNAINKLFTNLDTEQLGTTVSTFVSSLVTLIGNFFATVDFESIATGIANGISSIFSGDSAAFEEAIPNIANGFVTLLTTAIGQIDWTLIADSLVGGIQTIMSSLGESMTGSDSPLVSGFGEVILALNDAISLLLPAISSVLQAISPIIQSVLPVLTTLLPPIAEIITQVVNMVLPVLVDIFNVIMPILSELMAAVMPLILDLLQSMQPIFDALTGTVLPVIQHALEACMPLITSLLDLVTDLLAPIMSLLGPLIEIVFEILDPIITILEPIMDILATLCDTIGDVLRPVLEAITPVLDAVSAIFGILGPFIEVCLTPLDMLADSFKLSSSIMKSVVVPILNILVGVIDLLAGCVEVMAEGFQTAWKSIKEGIEKIRDKIKAPLNAILSAIESFVNGLIRGINQAIKALNAMSFTVPDWVPLIGGKSFGFNLKEIREVKIPKLAQGAVIPPNKEFLAMLGDQKHGTNIEAPLDTIKQAVAEVLAELGGVGGRQPIVLQVNGRTLAQVVWDEQEKRYKQTGKSMA